MKVSVKPTEIPDVLVVSHEIFEDSRGFLMEAFRKDVFEAANLPTGFVQFNHSRSPKHVIRGLHFQWSPPMGKLMRVIFGTAFLVAVDIRKGSPTLGKAFTIQLSEKDKKQVWAPAGFARGFCALSEYVEIQYFGTGTYNASGEGGIRWNDPALAIPWPISNPSVSQKDATAPTLAEWLAKKESDEFRYPR
jgi:dTDP-4-dehydrorhamnose 3,5-epimerase